jgi:tetraprenyl-beta-curcumene synthase
MHSATTSSPLPNTFEQLGSGLAETELTLRTGVALARANVRYWSDVAPQVRRELRRWSGQAMMIPDPRLRAIAIDKLRAEHFNAEVAATLATTASAEHRVHAVEAIVALELLYDYLDGLTEAPATDPLRDGSQAYRALTAVFDVDPSAAHLLELSLEECVDDGGYLPLLCASARAAIAALPSAPVVASAGRRAVERCAAGQVRVHATPQLGAGQLEQWARGRAATEPRADWREYLAGAVASILVVHALIAAAAEERTTEAQAQAIDAAYLSISALSTMLDSLVDHERDIRCGDPWLVRLYGDPRALGENLPDAARRAVGQVRLLPNAAHHLMTLSGVVAYYTSAPEARRGAARQAVLELHGELRPAILPTLAVMRSWRLAKKLRRSSAGRLRP